MRIGFVGLAHSHPFTDIRVAREQGVEDFVVCSTEAEKLARFRTENTCRVVDSVADLVATRPDVVVITVRPAEYAAVVGELLDAGIACFANKIPVVDEAQLVALDRAVGDRQAGFFTASVLRFAPATVDLVERVANERLVSARALVRHDIAAFLEPERAWQDDPVVGGGTLFSMGLHGVELLDAVAGTGIEVVGATRSTRVHTANQSEDVVAAAVRWAEGSLGVLEIIGSGHERYSVELQTATETIRAELAGPDPLEALGYRGTMRAILELAAGGAPGVAWPRSRAVFEALLSMGRMARSG